jgi:hypothetical protein
MKRLALCCALMVCSLGPLFAQSFGSVDNDKAETETVIDDQRGFTAQVDVDTNLFQVTQTEFSDAQDRYNDPKLHRTNSMLINNYPFGGFNIFDDTKVSFGYNGDWYGGNLSVNGNNSAEYHISLGGVKGWLSFFDGKFKISAGNDLGYGYADTQGADAGLRVYDDHVRTTDARNNETVDSSKNPDNITQDQGILFEFDLNPLKIALAGGGNITDLAKDMGRLQSAANDDPLYGYSLQYGVNIGSKIGDLAKVNGAYVLQAEKDENKYSYNPTEDKIVASSADAETWNHLFGFYASFYPLANDQLGLTVGYAGEFVKYLEEYEVDAKTTLPGILKQGINFMARYKTEKLTIKTDHNYSFWTDKNYNIYNLYKPAEDKMIDYGLNADTSGASDMADVVHSFLWNGIGASYHFTPVIEGSIYTRNLLRIDETEDYKMTTMYFSVELRSTFRLSPHVEAYGGITWRYTARTTSQGIAAASEEFGLDPELAKETKDFVNMIQIPIGVTVKLQ